MAATPPLNVSTEPVRRRSVFREELDETEDIAAPKLQSRPSRLLRFNSKPDVFEYDSSEDGSDDAQSESDESQQKRVSHPTSIQEMRKAQSAARARVEGSSFIYRFSATALILAILVPLLHGVPWVGHASVSPIGVTGGVIRREPNPVVEVQDTNLAKRDNSPTDVCTRWSHQTAVVNGTLYIYGGQATTEPQQPDNFWNNNFLTLDLTSGWQISTPSLTGLAQPSGPPNVSNGYLWNSHESLYLYGGEFSWKPPVTPTAFSMWEYDIAGSSWSEHQNPMTSDGVNAASGGVAVQRAGEGAGFAVPALGRGWWFGGHQDEWTTEGWSYYTTRVYLQSLLEFTFPGVANNQVTSLSNGQTAGSDGVWRNITEGGTQATAGFPERADGLLLYIPGFGADGVLIGLAGGTNTTFQQMNEVDVYDIASSAWYKQATSGETPNMRVNPCAVVAAAADGSSYNVHMFGGQNLQPAGEQIQYSDMWVLTIPSFTWIQVDTSGQSVPSGRSGHTCNVWDAQMVVVGGYVGDQISCDSPGIYVFDLGSLKWVEKFTATSSGSDDDTSSTSTASAADVSSSSFVSSGKTNPFNQQLAQIGNGSNPAALEGSYGYTVPAAIISVIGGNSSGGATITAPAQTATAGPMATGSAITYTVTGPDGATVTETSSAQSNGSNSGSSGPNIAAIVAGIIAGLLFILACYLIFCIWVYRRQLALYKRHVEVQQRHTEKEPFTAAPMLRDYFAPDGSRGASSDRSGARGRFLPDGTKLSSDGSGNNKTGWSGDTVSGSASRGATSGGNESNTLRRGSSGGQSVEDDLMGAREPTFLGVMLAPRRSLRVINRD